MNEIDDMALRLRTVVRLLVRRAYHASEDGPTRSEQGVLACLEEQGEMTPGALAALEKVRPQTLGQTLDSLSKRRWIKRSPHLKDRRQVLISISAAGRKALLKNRAARQAWLVGELKKLGAEERQDLIKSLDVLERIAQG